MRIHDGAYGTLLAEHLHGDETVDDLCVRAPGLVVDAHRAYLEAGAGAIQTNGFLAHLRGSDRRRRELRRAALECAREAAANTGGGTAIVFATIGPIGDRPRDFWEPIEQALESDAQGVLCETVTSRAMADSFLAAWREVAAGVGAVEVMLGCSTNPTDGAASRWVVELAGDAPDVVQLGLNCCEGPGDMRGLLGAIVEVRGASWAMPSAGIPSGNPPTWPFAVPVEWAACVADAAAELQLSGIGGCCGTTPDHVAALVARDEMVGSPTTAR